jgi:dipeptidyl aminopeptidase/acylaminoacyl peptidase
MTVAAMLERPDFYKVGVAASGNHDNNIYRQQWAETFHGVKNEGGCFTCKVPTNIERAENLKGKLMLITGDVDDNVHPAGTYRLVNAFIKKKKKFDMMVFPGVDHGMGGEYYVNLIHDYFTEHLK